MTKTSSLANEATRAQLRRTLASIPAHERDAWMERLWGEDDGGDEATLPRGCVPYLPCPVATVLEALTLANVTDDDVFVDIGSGSGRSLALAHLWTGASAIGIEIQPGLVERARARAAAHGLSQVRFWEGDAVELVPRVEVGTVFFMYCPFSGERLRRVLAALEAIARAHPIRLACIDMPALGDAWLEPINDPEAEVCVYRSTLPALGPRR